jgi:hypothetical protein
MALILIKDGYTPEDAINAIRTHRGQDALFNTSFVDWLMRDGASFFSPSSSQEAA